MKAYILGFFASIVLTFLSYFLVTQHMASGLQLDIYIGALVLLQVVLQLLLFFNLKQETSPRWNLIAFLFMLLVVIVLVVGSIWIMANLNYNLM